MEIEGQQGSRRDDEFYVVQVTQHGACLGLGLAALGTEDEVVFEEIKNVLYTDSAVAGEAAGIALGLVSVGSASDKASELLTYAHDTQHEKVFPACFHDTASSPRWALLLLLLFCLLSEHGAVEQLPIIIFLLADYPRSGAGPGADHVWAGGGC